MKKTLEDIINLYTQLYQKSWSYAIIFLRYGAWQDVIVVFHFGLFFALLTPNSPENENSKKMKKSPGDIAILYMCSKNYD